MGLDIYAGTLTRYYSNDWKTSIQRFAEDHGKEYSRVSPDGSEYDLGPKDPELYRDDVGEWMDYILESLERDGGGSHGRWNDDDGCPYYTGWPDWDGFGALLMVTACNIYDEPVPARVRKDRPADGDRLQHLRRACARQGEEGLEVPRGAARGQSVR